jgi:hypothetical protein
MHCNIFSWNFRRTLKYSLSLSFSYILQTWLSGVLLLLYGRSIMFPWGPLDPAFLAYAQDSTSSVAQMLLVRFCSLVHYNSQLESHFKCSVVGSSVSRSDSDQCSLLLGDYELSSHCTFKPRSILCVLSSPINYRLSPDQIPRRVSAFFICH